MRAFDRSMRRLTLEAQGRVLVERLGGRWRPGGAMCRCPAHDDRTPSLSVRVGERELLFHCFAGCATHEVIRLLRALHLIETRGPARVSVSPADPASAYRSLAARLWATARPIDRTPAEAYLRARGLTIAGPELRYQARTPDGRGTSAMFKPALLAAVRDSSGLVAVHRTFLGAHGASRPVARRALGRLGGGAVRLGPPVDGQLGLAEGIETALAATLVTGIPCWATLGAERFARVALPTGVDRLLLFLDQDAGGRRAEQLARAAHRGSSIRLEACYPGVDAADWNDILQASPGQAVAPANQVDVQHASRGVGGRAPFRRETVGQPAIDNRSQQH